MPTLHIRVAGQTFEAPLPETAVRVGSAADADLALACEGVAAQHCVLEPMAQGQWRLRDLGSGHPTRVNGIEVRQVSLKPGDRLEVGEAEIVYAPELAPVPAPLSATQASPYVPPAAASAAASAPTSIEASASRAASTPLAPAPVPTIRTDASSRRLLVPVALLLLVGGVLAFFGLSGGAPSGGGEAQARADLARAIERYRAKDVLGARADLVALLARVRTGDVAREASTWLESANLAVGQAQGALDRWAPQALDFDLSLSASRKGVFLEEHGAGFAAHVDAALASIRAQQEAWRAQEVERVEREVGALLDAGRYHEARARWTRAGETAPTGVPLTAEVVAGHGAVDARAELGSADLLERVERAVTHRGPAAGLELLSPSLANYEGVSAHGKLVERLQELERRAREQRPTEPTPGPGPTPTPGGMPAPARPPAPSSAEALAALLRAVEAEVGAAVEQRAFARAVERLDAALAQVGDGPGKQALTDRRGDLALARNGLDLLAGALTEKPEKFGRFEMGERVFVAPTAADREGVTVAVSGGTTHLAWSRMKRELVTLLAERMGASTQDALPLAAMLHEIGAAEACERLLVRAGEGGANTAVLFSMLARWRGEPVPEGGYVAYEGRYVTLEVREQLILASRIRGGLDRLLQARDAAARAAAVGELLALGEPARPALVKALLDRRQALVNEIAGRKVWTSGRTRQRLYELLEKRRAHALALIEDEQAYPYPNPGHQNQAEVERRVDEVREIWERPFKVVAGFDDEVREALGLLTELDEALAKASPSHRPDLRVLEELASKAVDMPAYAPGSAAGQREYALKVLAFNERIETTATREERDNVRAVNEYRMMMGRWPVKIEERLVRAARGHSRHMQTFDYFAHVNPAFPEVKDPGTRARRQGYGGGVGENIAWGTPSGRDAFRAWFTSSGHHRNMLGRGWTEMGAGRSAPSHWTQLFGAASGRSLSDPDRQPAPAADVAPDPEGAGDRPSGPLVPRLPDERPPGMPPDTPPVPEETPR